MKRKGMWADFTEEDIELMLAIRREEEARAEKAAERSSRPQRSAQSPAAQATPDRRIAVKAKKPGAGGTGRSPKAR
jgi:hypothetical protein